MLDNLSTHLSAKWSSLIVFKQLENEIYISKAVSSLSRSSLEFVKLEFVKFGSLEELLQSRNLSP